MTLGEALKLGENTLRRAKIESRRIDTMLILEKVSGKDRAWILAHPEHELSQEDASRFYDLIDARRKHTPLVHLTNEREFYGLSFYIDARVLTPRIETEQMAEWAIKYTPKDGQLIDIGTGSGAIAVAIATHRADLTITATEVSEDALSVAKQNAETHKTPITFVMSDLWEGVSEETQYDTIVTNLPYLQDDADLMPEVQKEPAVALFGGPDGLDLYRRFLAGISQYLAVGGHLFTECDPWQHEALINEAARYNLKPVEQGYFILGFEKTA